MESVPVMIANKAAWDDPWKRAKIEQIATLLQSALRAEGMVGLKMNAPADTHRGDHRRPAEPEEPDGVAPLQIRLGLDRKHPAGEGSAPASSRNCCASAPKGSSSTR